MKNKGFTLVELVVTMVILGLVFSGVMGAYYMLLQTRDRVDLEREMQKEVSFAITRMTDKIRAESVDYQAYESGGRCQSTYLQGAQKICLGDHWYLFFDGASSQLFIENSVGQRQGLFSHKFLVTSAEFYTTPEKDPYDPAHIAISDYQLHPKTQIYLEVASVRKNKNNTDPLIKMDIQTTVSSRQYN